MRTTLLPVGESTKIQGSQSHWLRDPHAEFTATTSKINYSHSMVAGGLDVTSKTTRFTSATELVMRVEMRARTS